MYDASRMLSNVEKNYSTIEREALGMIYYVNKFCHYLLGNKFVFHVDHQALVYLVNKPNLVGKLVRWMMLLQEFDFTILGSEHTIVDFLSRIDSGEPADEVPEQFSDADLFTIEEAALDWYDEIMGFLTTRTFPI